MKILRISNFTYGVKFVKSSFKHLNTLIKMSEGSVSQNSQANCRETQSVSSNLAKPNCQKCNIQLTQFQKGKKVIKPKSTDKFVCGCGAVVCYKHIFPNHECPLDYYEQPLN